MSQTTRELKEGVDKNGRAFWVVITTRGCNWIHTERFDNKPEAEAWLKWA